MSQDVNETWARQLARADIVPVCRPMLPTRAELEPYLAQIDASRRYSNHGHLVLELQRRLSDRLGGNYVAVASSGTSAIVGAILATAGRARRGKTICLLPANTFIGSVVAVEQCGYEPYFVDVDEETWQLLPEQLRSHPLLPAAGLVLAVSAYGRSVSQLAWKRFRDDNDIPVVIDGAAMIEAAMNSPEDCIGSIPVAISFHATKSFATGEGGAVVINDEATWKMALRAMNFGYDIDRLSKSPSINGKMSEYHAAVGLAELDRWEEKIAGYRRAADHLRRINELTGYLVMAPHIASCYAIHVATTPEMGRKLRKKLSDANIGCRQWYGAGAHAHSYTSVYGRDCLPATENLVETLTGLPMSPDLDDADAALIATALSERDEFTA